jgi:hypothetical protein
MIRRNVVMGASLSRPPSGDRARRHTRKASRAAGGAGADRRSAFGGSASCSTIRAASRMRRTGSPAWR